MKESSAPSQIVLGFALFSMFFGSGNLIFPLFLGQFAQANWFVAFLGFFLTAVCLPLLGVIAMVLYEGRYRKFFNLIGSPWGFLLTLALLLVWIPLGSAPRCISLSFASLGTYLPVGSSPWIYGALYSIGTAIIVLQPRRMLSLLGKYLTPAFLVCLAAIFIAGMYNAPEAIAANDQDATALLFTSLKEGYNTMDLIAAFFFSASIIGILEKQGGNLKSHLKLTFQAGFVSAIVLAIVYAGLLYTSAVYSQELQGMSKELMLAHLAKITLGPQLGIIAAIAIFLACFTTSVALISVFADFLTESVFRSKSWYPLSLGITLVSAYLMSITRLEGITAVTAPVLQVSYPLLLVVILYGIAKRSWEIYSERKLVEKDSIEPNLSID